MFLTAADRWRYDATRSICPAGTPSRSAKPGTTVRPGRRPALPLGAVVLVSVMVLAASAHRAGIWPGWISGGLIALLALPAGLMAVLAFLPWYTASESGLDPLRLIGPIGAIWLFVGLGLLRGFATRSRA